MILITKEKEIVWVQILYLFVIPTLLLYFKVVPGDFRMVMLFGIAILMIGIVKNNHWTLSDLGIYKNFNKDFIPYLLFTIAGVLFLVWLSAIIDHSPFLNWWKSAKFLLLFIPISVIQEIVFRGVLMKLLRRAFSNPVFVIGLNAVVFALIHVIYVNATFVLPMTFIAGIGFAWMYYNYPNLVLISISHTILNFVGMVLGFFVLR
jgi:membrane protease YdiL (CAAX protease family)